MIGRPVHDACLSPNCLSLFHTNRQEFLQALYDELKEHQDFHKLLRRFCTGKRETINKYSIIIQKAGVTVNDKGEGTVWFTFAGEADFGCKGLNNIHDHYEELRFKIDFDNRILQFYCDDPPEREPDRF